MTLATYAKKCGVSREKLEEDAYGLIPLMNTKGDAFTEDDVLHALEAFTDSYITYPIDTIVNRTGIPIEKNKRNYRKQRDHVKVMNTMKALKKQLGEEVKEGRPKGSGTAEQIVREWKGLHPDGRKADCIRETGLSKPTVYKWWKTGAYYTDPEEMRQNESSEAVTKSALTSDNQMYKRLRAYAEQFSLFEEEKRLKEKG